MLIIVRVMRVEGRECEVDFYEEVMLERSRDLEGEMEVGR